MPNSQHMCRIALLQTSVQNDRVSNLQNVITVVRKAAESGAQIICLQELFDLPYFCQEENTAWFDLAEPIPGPTSKRFQQVARELGVVVVVPIFERRTVGIYHNSAAVIDADGSLVGVYRKMHVPDDPLYYEKFYFSPGDRGFQVFETKFARMGVLICWDQWYPEAARLTALQGAEILFCPTAIGWHPAEKHSDGKGQFDAWCIVQRSHAVSNGIFVATVNRVGHERLLEGSQNRPIDYEGIDFWGGSFVADPMGKVIAEAGRQSDEILITDCDLNLIKEARHNWPFLRDRRTDAYEGITARFIDKQEK